jgi:hypothetical protein
MATNKAKRPILLAQPKPKPKLNLKRRSLNPNPEQILRPKNGLRISPAGSQPLRKRLHACKASQSPELMPVKAHVYRAIAELNGGFEKVIQDLQTLGSIAFFRSDNVTAMRDLICWIRAQANREFTMTLQDREMANAGHFERLCIEHEKTRQAAS